MAEQNVSTRLQQEFENSVASLNRRVDGLEARAGQLEGSQFSTTTKLQSRSTFIIGNKSYTGNEPIEIKPLDTRFGLSLSYEYKGSDTFGIGVGETFAQSLIGKGVEQNIQYSNGKALVYNWSYSDILGNDAEGSQEYFSTSGDFLSDPLSTKINVNRFFYNKPGVGDSGYLLEFGRPISVGALPTDAQNSLNYFKTDVAVWPSVYPSDSDIIDEVNLNTDILLKGILEFNDNIIMGTLYSDYIRTWGANDIIYTFKGNDVNITGGGADYVESGDGADDNRGGAGGDGIVSGSGADTNRGGDGSDLIKSGSGSDTNFGGSGRDGMFSGGGDDNNLGGSGNDYIESGSGSDKNIGGGGDDLIKAGSGRDVIIGGAGSNAAIGGGGDDDYVIGKPLSAGSNQKFYTEIVDFSFLGRERVTIEGKTNNIVLQEVSNGVNIYQDGSIIGLMIGAAQSDFGLSGNEINVTPWIYNSFGASIETNFQF